MVKKSLNHYLLLDQITYVKINRKYFMDIKFGKKYTTKYKFYFLSLLQHVKCNILLQLFRPVVFNSLFHVFGSLRNKYLIEIYNVIKIIQILCRLT